MPSGYHFDYFESTRAKINKSPKYMNHLEHFKSTRTFEGSILYKA